jgi:hypothetical protein
MIDMKYTLYLLAIFMAFAICSCNNDQEIITDGNFTLEFSLDTLRFDTVFTQLGSATRSFKVYNRGDKAVSIQNISIAGNEGGRFMMNVDGIAGDEVEDVVVWANDSIYVFVETTIDPDQPLSVSPFVIEDRIIFNTGEKEQSVMLEAWGQNANYIPNRFNKGGITLLSCDNQTIVWDDPKPYVVYGVLLIDTCVLEVAAGTRIHVHGGVAQNEVFGVFNDGLIYTLSQGSIRLLGTREDSIIIQGDRLEEGFAEESGQWQGMVIGRGSRGNLMEYTVVKNGVFSVYVDSLAEFTARNSRFYNTNSSGVIGFNSQITLENCLLYNNQANALQLILGGVYDFKYCTVANYGVDASALYMSNYFCYDFNCNVSAQAPLLASFTNCILFGSGRDELVFDDGFNAQNPALYNIAFNNCIVKLDQVLDDEEGGYADFLEKQCVNCINASRDDALFVSVSNDNYRLDTLSVAEMQALPLSEITTDIVGNGRDASQPDIGCFEYQY